MRTNSSEKSGARRAALDSRLSGYSTGARLAAAARRLRSRTGNWPVYAAAAGSALAMTTSASASIIAGVYQGCDHCNGPHGGASVGPQTHSQSSLKGLPFAAGEINIRAQSGSNAFGHFTNFSVEGVLPLKIFESGAYGQYVMNFGAGARISSAAGVHAAAGGKIAKALFSASSVGNFSSGVPGYVGFALDQVGGGVNYGWLKLEFSFDPPASKQGVLEVLGFGYETTAGKAIAAGDTGGSTATPEPGTMALGILAAGAAGVAALRRRRQAA